MKSDTSKRSAVGRAFSLIETLTVVVILAVLAGVLLPAYRAMKSSAASAQCVQNLRHIYVSTLAFIEDHDGFLPPDLGPQTGIHPRFNMNQYWWNTAYLGRYVLNDHARRRDSPGKVRPEEMGLFQCPVRLRDGPDAPWGDDGVTYVMQKLFSSPRNYQFRAMENKSKKLFLTEGRWSTLVPGNALTGNFGMQEKSKRLRRYHNNGLNILFFDGHIERFDGSDEEMHPLLKSGSD